MFYRVFTTNCLRRVNRSGKLARNTCVTLLCLFYLISNTHAFPSLYQGKSCRCAEQVQAKSTCCCFNKTRGNKGTDSKSACSTGNHAKEDCCSNRNKQQSNSKTDSRHSQIMSSCGCGSSAKYKLHSNAPRDVNPGPILQTPENLTVPLVIADISPVKFDCAPDTPPPQQQLA